MISKEKQQNAQSLSSGCLFSGKALFQIFHPLSKDNPVDNSCTTGPPLAVTAAPAHFFFPPTPRRKDAAHKNSCAASPCHTKEIWRCPQTWTTTLFERFEWKKEEARKGRIFSHKNRPEFILRPAIRAANALRAKTRQSLIGSLTPRHRSWPLCLLGR